jgi:hypothetical protein
MTEIGEFKGHAVIILKRTDDDKYPFSFGVGKAKMILENLQEIKNFVKTHSKED